MPNIGKDGLTGEYFSPGWLVAEVEPEEQEDGAIDDEAVGSMMIQERQVSSTKNKLSHVPFTCCE